ncbi:hypothetical protein [Formosa haliotis]|uniref:hypothetical protein n=1 Tax=Formosa haliotis TaxID=1555194 RepID=UPI000825BB75|nr:hypothetical protein [Formosa haliotis]
MENHIKDIELINRYLNKSLSKSETTYFEERLKIDFEFRSLFEEHIAILEGIKRQQLKAEIISGKKIYTRHKWLKYLGFTTLALLIIASVFVFTDDNNSEIIKKDNNAIEVVTRPVSKDTLTSFKPTTDTVVEKEVIKETQKQTNTAAVKSEVTTKIEEEDIKIPKKPFQTFTCNSEKDTTLVCKEGTKLIMKKSSFLDKNKNIITGNIDLEVTEYYTLSDMILANLSTQSNGTLLETGGMLNIKAYQNNEPLHLAPNTTIEILFPTTSKKEGMQLFTGTWDHEQINWKLQDESAEEAENEKVAVQEEQVEVPFSIVEIPPAYPGCEHLEPSASKKCTSVAISKFVMANFNTEIAMNLGLTGRQRINTIFKINQEGRPVSITSRASEPELEIEANRVIALLPKMTPGKQRGKTVIVPYSLPIVFQAESNQLSALTGSTPRKETLRRDSIVNKKFEDKLIENSASVKAYELNAYILRTSKLGWINCDRFIRRANIPFKFKIKNAGDDIRVTMVFKSIKSVIPSSRLGDTFHFKGVPKDENVVLIAIKKDQDKWYLGSLETKTEENPKIEFDFREINVQELKSEIEKLNLNF